jgi:integrase
MATSHPWTRVQRQNVQAIRQIRLRPHEQARLKPVLERADELLADRDQHPLPLGVTPHKLRQTYASVLIALGRDPRYVMEQLGHTDPKFTLRAYAHAMRFGGGPPG